MLSIMTEILSWKNKKTHQKNKSQTKHNRFEPELWFDQGWGRAGKKKNKQCCILLFWIPFLIYVSTRNEDNDFLANRRLNWEDLLFTSEVTQVMKKYFLNHWLHFVVIKKK